MSLRTEQVKEAALFARVEALRAQRAALQAELRPLLEQHEALAARLPFHRLQARGGTPDCAPWDINLGC